MEKIKIIELLNRIANKEKVPREIIYKGNHYYNVGNEEQAYYENSELDDCILLLAVYNEKGLNDYVEILEEDKKIEKIIPTSLKGIDNLDEKIEIAHIDTISAIDKINEIIDRLNNE